MIKLSLEENKKYRALVDKIYEGDGFTDAELDKAIELFTDLEWRLGLLGARFHHAWLDVYQHLVCFEGFKASREEGKKARAAR